jgi:iron complex outermembrane recepter protein
MLYSYPFKKIFIPFFCLFFAVLAYAENGSIHGTISDDDDRPIPGVLVFLSPTNKSATTNADGSFGFSALQPGQYQLKATASGFKDVHQAITIEAEKTISVDLKMAISPLSENVVVTASPETQTTLKTYQPTNTLTSTDLQQNLSGTLGETLKEQPGVNMRNFGPGAARPVIRGFDGDRVLILQDGQRTGDLSSQSGDHGVPIDPASVEKIEVIRGPASLLYGSNAIGGVVNAITEFHDSPFNGFEGHVTAEYGSVNEEGAGNGHVDVGTGNMIFHVAGGVRDASDYDTAHGTIQNSQTHTDLGRFGGDYVTDSGSFLGVIYNLDDLKYGIPLDPNDEEVRDLHIHRHHFDFHGGTSENGTGFHHLRFNAAYTDYRHDEIANGEIGTTFNNNVFEFRGLIDHPGYGRLTGSLGISGLHRDYETVGEEVLAPHTKQNNISVFDYEQLGMNWGSLQFGARLDHTSYTPEENFIDRSFTGVSGSSGVVVNIGSKSAFAANYGLAYRAPAIEELYNNGPHDGTLSFEIGDPNLDRELGNSFDASIRHQSDRIQAEFTAFYAKILNFIFFAPNGETDEESGLPIVLYQQGDSRFAGYEANVVAGLTKWLWVKVGSDYVDAQLDDGRHLPRIPPLRGHFGVELRYNGFIVSPEIVAVSKQDKVFDLETPTDGYTLFNIAASYTRNTQRLTHTFTVALKNTTDEFYRNHINVLKAIAPEPGRSFKFAYTLGFF